MYTDEMDLWLAEARREESVNEARVRQGVNLAQNQNDQEGVGVRNGEITQTVEDEEDHTTIRRAILPDL